MNQLFKIELISATNSTGKMKLNGREMVAFASHKKCDRDGRMYYKVLYSPSQASSDGMKEKWFKLKGNLLFYYKINEYGGLPSANEPSGLLVIEDCTVSLEDALPPFFSFSIQFHAEPGRKHLFSCLNQPSADAWVDILKNCSYETVRAKVADLRSQIIAKTGKDPLSRYPHGVKSGK